MGTFTKSAVLGLALTVVSWTPIAAQQGATDGQWRYYGGGPGGTAYSPLDYAYDKATGEIIADLEIPGTQTSLPMTYMHEDEQYVVFTVGGGGQPAQLIAMTLP